MSYVVKQDALRRTIGIKESVASLVDRWSTLVEECKAGYQWDVSELSNELRARDWLEMILSEPELQAFEEHRELVARVHEIDEQFRALLQPDLSIPGEQAWWRRGVLRAAGEEYARYMARAYGFRVDVVP